MIFFLLTKIKRSKDTSSFILKAVMFLSPDVPFAWNGVQWWWQSFCVSNTVTLLHTHTWHAFKYMLYSRCVFCVIKCISVDKNLKWSMLSKNWENGLLMECCKYCQSRWLIIIEQENNLAWKGYLEVNWSNLLFRAGLTSDKDQVVRCLWKSLPQETTPRLWSVCSCA